MGGGESEVSEESRRRSDERTGQAASAADTLEKRQGANFAEGISFIMELLKTPLISDHLAAEQKRDLDAQFAGAEKSILDDALAKFDSKGRGRDARADAMSRRVQLEGANARAKGRTDIDTTQATTNRNAELQTFVQLLSALQLQQQPTFQKMAALSGGATAQAQIAAANAIHNGGPDLAGLGALGGALPGIGEWLGV